MAVVGKLFSSQAQWLLIVEFMEGHGDLSRPQATPQGYSKLDDLWSELTDLLNSEGSGSARPAEKWKRVWSDLKTRVKKKASTIQTQRGAAGPGAGSTLSLTPLEERVLAIMGIRESSFTPTLGVEATPSSVEEFVLSDNVQQPNMAPVTDQELPTTAPSPPRRSPSPHRSPRPNPRWARNPRVILRFQRNPRLPTRGRPRLNPESQSHQTHYDRLLEIFHEMEFRKLEMDRERLELDRTRENNRREEAQRWLEVMERFTAACERGFASKRE